MATDFYNSIISSKYAKTKKKLSNEYKISYNIEDYIVEFNLRNLKGYTSYKIYHENDAYNDYK